MNLMSHLRPKVPALVQPAKPEKTILFLGEPLKQIDAHGMVGAGGDPVNFLVGAARLRPIISPLFNGVSNVKLGLIGAHGDTIRCQNILQYMTTAGVATDQLMTVRGRDAGEYRITTTPDGERSFTYKGRDTAAFREWFTEKGNNSRIHLLKSMGPDTTLVLSGISISRAKTADDFERLRGFVEAAKAKGARIVLDTNVRMALWQDQVPQVAPEELARERIGAIMALADCAYVSFPDDSGLWFGAQTPDQFAPTLFASGHMTQLVAKAGGKGATLYTQNPEGALAKAAIPVANIGKVIDTSGAGDTFMAGTELALSYGAGMRQALAVGAVAAGHIVTQSGAVLSDVNLPSGQELKDMEMRVLTERQQPVGQNIGR